MVKSKHRKAFIKNYLLILIGIILGAGLSWPRIIKKESWYVGKGSFEYIWLDTEKGVEKDRIIPTGTCITIERGQPHQLIALEDNSEIFEVSTQHFDEDSYRIRTGNILD